MQYRLDKYGNELSVLGYGCMRFTNTAGHIDMQKAEKEIMRAYELGVNYYDTAYIYTGLNGRNGSLRIASFATMCNESAITVLVRSGSVLNCFQGSFSVR